MTDDFDGYRKWLNITSPRRPPSHYELLGIKLDEDDHEIIQAAMEQRHNYVESKRGHGKDDLVSEILMRIDEAGITLLNNEMRRDYDRQMALFEKRRKNRRVDPNATSSRFESRPGRTVGEEPVIVKTFAGIMAVICLGFGIMAWFSFQLPWSKKVDQVEPTPVANRSIESSTQPPKTQSASTPTPVINNTETKTVVSKEKTEPSSALERMKAGDWLWELAEKETQSNSKFNMQKQAVNWYRKALPELSSEQRRHVEQQLSNLILPSSKVSIAANQSWQIGRKVKRGDLLITVASDTWNIWPTGGSEWQCDANGTTHNAGDSFPIMGSKQGVLIGQIGSKVFVIGSFAIFEVEDDGVLKMMCNDAEKFRPDNRGTIHVRIAVVGEELPVKEVMPTFVAPPRDDDRIAAENVLKAGGKLELLIDGKKVLVEKRGILPNQIFQISRIDLKDVNKVVDHDLQYQPQLSELRELILMSTSVSDAVFQPLTKYKKIVELNVAGTAVNGSGFIHLKENESLEILLCGGCPISDNNLVHLKSCKRLSVLGLIDTKVTDAGMEHLNDIPTLKELRLNGDRVTDKGVQKLTKLKGLTKLSLGRTKVTPAGVNAFKKAVPTCEVQLQ